MSQQHTDEFSALQNLHGSRNRHKIRLWCNKVYKCALTTTKHYFYGKHQVTHSVLLGFQGHFKRFLKFSMCFIDSGRRKVNMEEREWKEEGAMFLHLLIFHFSGEPGNSFPRKYSDSNFHFAFHFLTGHPTRVCCPKCSCRPLLL